MTEFSLVSNSSYVSTSTISEFDSLSQIAIFEVRNKNKKKQLVYSLVNLYQKKLTFNLEDSEAWFNISSLLDQYGYTYTLKNSIQIYTNKFAETTSTIPLSFYQNSMGIIESNINGNGGCTVNK